MLKKSFSALILIVMVLLNGCQVNSQVSDEVEALNELLSQQAAVMEQIGRGSQATESVTPSAPTVRETEPVVRVKGRYTLKEAKELEGFFVLYPDGSFDRYSSGIVLTWDMQPMTYGADYWPQDLVMGPSSIENNKTMLTEGKLVLFWSNDNRRIFKLYPVRESGYSLFRRDDNMKLEGLISTRGSINGKNFEQWNQGHVFYWSNSVDYATINGIPKEQYTEFPSAEGRDFADFPANQTYKIGIIEGTTLVEKEYQSNYMYFLQDYKAVSCSLIPTVDGYAIVDFSDAPVGEYILTISSWDESDRSRVVRTTYVEIN